MACRIFTHTLCVLFCASVFVWDVECVTPTFCTFPNLQAYAQPHDFKPISTDDYNFNCLRYPSFNATIYDSKLTVAGCAHAEYKLSGTHEWVTYASPVFIAKGKAVNVRCENVQPVLLVNPPTINQLTSNSGSSTNPSVFVVMIDAVSYEAMHRLMPNTVNMLQNLDDVDVYEFTKPMYSTVGLNSNPNKFAMFGRHDYHHHLRHDPSRPKFSWLWEYAKELGYTTVIAEDECPRHDSVWDLMNVPTSKNNLTIDGPDFVMLDQVCVVEPHPNKYCVEGRWGYEYVVDYVSEMLGNLEKQPNKKPIFMWSNFIDAHEPDQWAAAVMDNTVVNYLRSIIQSSFMDNGVIVFVSDHGIHFGDFAYSSALGTAENKHPFLYTIAKKGFFDKEILSANVDKLVTPFDIHQTLSSLIGHSTKDKRDIFSLSAFHMIEPVKWLEFHMNTVFARTDQKHAPHYYLLTYGKYANHDMLTHDFLTGSIMYYTKAELMPRFGREFTECEAMAHWCAFGLSQGKNGTATFSLRAYVARTPELAEEFCWSWPNDCNWGRIAEYYFKQGFISDDQ